MANDSKSKPVIASFTADGSYLAILSPTGTVKVWNTSNGSLLAEWNQSSGGSTSYSCMACGFTGKKRKKDRVSFPLALGTNEGDVLVVDIVTGNCKWKKGACHPGGVAGLSFVKKVHSLLSVGTKGMVVERNSESGEIVREFKASKKPISSLSFCSDETLLAVVSRKTQVISLENGKELLKFPDDLDQVFHISLSNDAKTVVTSGFGEKNIQVWRCDLDSESVSSGPTLSMKSSPLAIECKSSLTEKEDSLGVLAISATGFVYVWNFKTLQGEVSPAKITAKCNNTDREQQNGGSAKKKQISIFAARFHALEDDGHLKVLVAYGSDDHPQFSVVTVNHSGENIVVNASDEIKTVRENGVLAEKDLQELGSEATVITSQNKKSQKKRAAADADLATDGEVVHTDDGETMDGILVEDDLNEPTMGEKLESLNLQENSESKSNEEQESAHAKPPSADSVNVLLKQALHADDRALLLDCLYTQDEKVIANSISQLNQCDVLKLLHSLVSIIESRGAILACALPWLRSLLLQHASGIMSHESPLLALNSLYQLIESRVSTFQSALQLSSCLDVLLAGVVDETVEETETIVPAIYEDNDDSDQAESEDGMDTDQDSDTEDAEGFEEIDDFEDSDGASD